MGLFELFGKKPLVGSSVYALSCALHPFRLGAHKNDAVDLEVDLQNTSDKELLTSVVVEVQKPVSLDSTGLTNQREIRLGLLSPGERKQLKIAIYSNARVQPGTYDVRVFAVEHYRDYGHVINEVKKTLTLRAA
ncbi:MAG: hypothetical protein QW343_00535 [Candidatus Norongarragalinales archaeon]